MSHAIAVFLAAIIALAFSASSPRDDQGPPAGQATTRSSYQPDQPYEVQSDGVLTRSVYRTDVSGPFRTEITDMIVPPGKAASLRYDAAVVIEIREGIGSTTLQEKTGSLNTGSTFGLSQGQSAKIENTSKQPLVLRAYIVTSQ